ncbi:hypothetical protein COU58_01685 [Candidatus Pacearchaeota archaeon CG10_big_fil_rev_8_21_14_0_10_32_42]|nr:MAG: hypothetical protein COU58_01685 [Candidatus Pacearchaeota archaeon CG10_big_fil_rev_8_21_14_0_10_32_42]
MDTQYSYDEKSLFYKVKRFETEKILGKNILDVIDEIRENKLFNLENVSFSGFDEREVKSLSALVEDYQNILIDDLL